MMQLSMLVLLLKLSSGGPGQWIWVAFEINWMTKVCSAAYCCLYVAWDGWDATPANHDVKCCQSDVYRV